MDRGVIRALPAGLCLLLAGCGGGGGGDRPAGGSRGPVLGDWRRVAQPADRERLREWRTAWTVSLRAAMDTRDGAAAIAADPALFDPDRVLPHPIPPTGDYRCRTIKLGRRGAARIGYVARDWFRCRVAGEDPPVALTKIDGSQRQSGLIYADTDSRAVLLGVLTLGDEARPMRYGRDGRRDVAGIVERIGDHRWRVVFPYPAFESTLDLLELRSP